ncbi:alpha/beta hydrolase family protein [Asticcacaulis solisilvae]|uniref:alpha/beta hydrolase family protein n=1 Tax=Asticcacaulis solisilvae TaxID=1217274 RepID=UPI003FD8E513
MTASFNRRILLAGAGAGLGLAFGARAEDAKAPAKPETPAPSVELYARSPLVSNIALSPDGKRVALINQKDDTNFLVFFDIAGGKPKRVGLGAGKMRGLLWADNDHVVIINSVTTSLPELAASKSELYLASCLDLNTLKMANFFSRDDEFYNIVEGDIRRIKVNGEYRVTASNFKRNPPFDEYLYSFAADSGHGHEIMSGSQYAETFLTTPQGEPVAYSEYDEDRKTWTLYYNTGTPGHSRYEAIYKKKEDGRYTSLEGLGRDGKSVVIRTYADGVVATYHEISADGALGPALDADSKDKDHTPLFHPTTWRLCGFSHRDDQVVKSYDDPLMKKLNEAIPQVVGDGARSYIVDFAEDPRKMIVYSQSASDAGSYAFIDFSNGDTTAIAFDYPDLAEEWITSKQAIDYKAADGLNIHAYLTLPPFKEAKNLPLIVLPHGGPQARDTLDYDWQTQVFASRGYAVLQPNYRGSEGYGDAFISAGQGEWGRKMQTDLSDGVRYLAQKGIVDLKRVAIFGASYGGYAAMAGATLDPGVYRCSVAIAGISDLKSFISAREDDSGRVDSSMVRYWKTQFGDQKTWDDASPAKQAARAYCPILLIHGTDDTVVPIDQSRRMEKALKAAGKDVEFITYKGQDHWETIPSARITMMQASLDFIMKHNPA